MDEQKPSSLTTKCKNERRQKAITQHKKKSTSKQVWLVLILEGETFHHGCLEITVSTTTTTSTTSTTNLKQFVFPRNKSLDITRTWCCLQAMRFASNPWLSQHGTFPLRGVQREREREKNPKARTVGRRRQKTGTGSRQDIEIRALWVLAESSIIPTPLRLWCWREKEIG